MEAFLGSTLVVAIGDKTQLATVALAARFDSRVAVLAGTTIPFQAIRYLAAAALAGFSFAKKGARLNPDGKKGARLKPDMVSRRQV